MTATAATQAELFKILDAYAERLKRKLRQEFNRIRLAGWDELNVLRTTKMTQRIYARIDRMNREAYAEMCRNTYGWVYAQYGKKPPERDWGIYAERWLTLYDPVTLYQYDNELDRKRMRLNEGILTARETQDRGVLENVLKTAVNLLLTQSLQYGLDIIGQAETDAFEEAEDEDALVQYHACDDSRTCAECREDDGKIYRISEAPRIPRHYRCRCWYTRVRS